jgi:hypothetical protein
MKIRTKLNAIQTGDAIAKLAFAAKDLGKNE